MHIARRPFGIFALAVFALLGGMWTLAAAAGLRPLDDYRVGDLVLDAWVPQLISGAWGVMLVIAAILLLLLHRWGWELLMLSTGIGLFGALWQWWIGNLEPVRMALLVLTAFYLNGREVREVLFRVHERARVVPLAPLEGGHR